MQKNETHCWGFTKRWFIGFKNAMHAQHVWDPLQCWSAAEWSPEVFCRLPQGQLPSLRAACQPWSYRWA
eukprot:4709997-Amphidinium_carterae.1